jgi:hypothetical protein
VYELEAHVEFLRVFFASRWEYGAGVKELLRYGQSVAPGAPWGELDRLDVKREARSFELWLEGNRPVDVAGIRAFYFGIAEDGGAVHLDGTADFDPADEACDWACEYVFRSEEDWGDSLALQTFGVISEKADGELPVLLYVLCLGFVGLLVQRHGKALAGPVAVGFDDGDAYVLPA